jgi:hypothetical protein
MKCSNSGAVIARLFFRMVLNGEGIKRYRVDRSERIDIAGTPMWKGMKNTVRGLRTDKVFVYFT